MTKYILSICIPTANRKIELESQIISLQKQINENNLMEKVQIVIGDNTDNEDQLISNELTSALNVKYIKNQSNIGYARNVNNVLSAADGQYGWLLSDDDPTYPHAISTIYSKLLYSNAYYISFDCGGTYLGKKFVDRMYFKDLERDAKISGHAFIKKYWESMIFISINIFNLEKTKSHLEKHNLDRAINEVYQNSYLGISMLHETNGSVEIINESLLDDNFGNKVYAPGRINDVAVDKYAKLLIQLSKFKVDYEILLKMKNILIRNIFSYGLLSTVYKIEYKKIEEHLKTFVKIFTDKNHFISVRTSALIIYILLRTPNWTSKLLCIPFLHVFRRENYKATVKCVNQIVLKSSEKIASTY